MCKSAESLRLLEMVWLMDDGNYLMGIGKFCGRLFFRKSKCFIYPKLLSRTYNLLALKKVNFKTYLKKKTQKKLHLLVN